MGDLYCSDVPNIIRGLECCSGGGCTGCPYGVHKRPLTASLASCRSRLMQDARERLIIAAALMGQGNDKANNG